MTSSTADSLSIGAIPSTQETSQTAKLISIGKTSTATEQFKSDHHSKAAKLSATETYGVGYLIKFLQL